MRDDLRGWGDFAAMMCVHPRDCGKPRYARAIISWIPALGVAMQEDNLMGKILRGLHYVTPTFIGPRIVQCTTCRSMCFKNRFPRGIMRVIRFVFDPAYNWGESILLMGEDIDAWGEDNHKEIGVEESKY